MRFLAKMWLQLSGEPKPSGFRLKHARDPATTARAHSFLAFPNFPRLSAPYLAAHLLVIVSEMPFQAPESGAFEGCINPMEKYPH